MGYQLNHSYSLIIEQAVLALQKGEIIAYPTEAVYGLGCDPNNVKAVERLLQLKQRAPDKGMIVVASDWEQVSNWCLPVPDDAYQTVKRSWPGPYTWLFPASELAPPWIIGAYATIALRISAHRVVKSLCQAFGSAIVSTSANRSNFPALKTAHAVSVQFGSQIAGIVGGPLGGLEKPTQIRDVITGEVERY